MHKRTTEGKLVASFLAEDIMGEHPMPWYLAQEDSNIDDWHSHYVLKGIPHAIVEHTNAKKRKIRSIWIRYRYDPKLGKGSDNGYRPEPVVPECLQERR